MKIEELDQLAQRLAERCKLDSWNSFIETIDLPRDAYPALLTGRPELIRLIQPRPLAENEAAALYKALAALIETNMALREHAEAVADLVGNWHQAFKHLGSVGNKIQHFARFDTISERGDDL